MVAARDTVSSYDYPPWAYEMAELVKALAAKPGPVVAFPLYLSK